MIEVYGNLWNAEADLIVITTNLTTRRDGSAVMGAGCAKEAAERFPNFPWDYGLFLADQGDTPIFNYDGQDIYCLPVKAHWAERADVKMIDNEIRGLVKHVNEVGYKSVAMPRPGCGNGGLQWWSVKQRIQHLLDDRFYVYHYG